MMNFKEHTLQRHCQRLLLISLLYLTCASTPVAGDSYPRSTTIDAIHYRLQLTLNPKSEEVRGETEILFEFKADGVREIALDFTGLTTDQVTEEKQSARFTHTGDKLKIALSRD